MNRYVAALLLHACTNLSRIQFIFAIAFLQVVGLAANQGSVAQTIAPTAKVGLLSDVVAGQPASLDGASSISPNGAQLSYQWSIVSKPNVSMAGLDNPLTVRPKLTPDLAGDYVVSLTVSAGSSVSAPAAIIVSTVNSNPVAHAGADQRAAIGQAVRLDASRSYDVDGDSLVYAWTLASKPASSVASLNADNLVRPSFTPDVAGSYVANLVVTDARGATSSIATTKISTLAVAPVAVAGPDHWVQPGQTVRLDAFESTDADGNRLTTSWSLISAPAGNTAQLSQSSFGFVSFTPQLIGSYVVQLKVSDGTDTGFDTIVIEAGSANNVSPVAITKANIKVAQGSNAVLDASSSFDANDDRLTYTWSLLAKPVTSNSSLSATQSVRKALQIDEPGDYVAVVKVRDAAGLVSVSTILLSTGPVPPIANAGPDKPLAANSTAVLNGAESVSPSGEPLTYAWSATGLAGADPITSVTVAPASDVAPTVTFAPAGVPLSEAVRSGPVSLPFTGTDTGQNNTYLRLTSMGRSTNLAGAPLTVWRIRNSGTTSRNVVLVGTGTSYSAPFTLGARTELFVGSPITAGPATHKLMENGVQRDVKAASTALFADNRLVGGGGLPEVAVVQLNATDGAVAFDTTVVSRGNLRPVAKAQAQQSVRTNTLVPLSAGQSSDPNGDTLTYAWALIHGPAGSTAMLSSTSASETSFMPDKKGYYVAQLRVFDRELTSQPATVAVYASNDDPEIVSAPITAATVSQPYIYDVDATDADNDTLVYSLTQAPQDMTIDAQTGAISWTPVAIGAASVAIEVSDGFGGVATQSFTLSVSSPPGNRPPVIAPIGPQFVVLGTSIALQIQASDPDGDPLTYSIQPRPLPQGASFNAATGQFSFRPSGTPGTDAFTFLVSDGTVTSTQDVTVSVTQGDTAQLASLTGRVIDATDNAAGTTTPVQGATVSLGNSSAVTDAAGTFSLSGVSIGQGILYVSGATASPAPGGASYGSAQRSITIYPGVSNTLGRDVALAHITGAGTPVNPGGTTTITDPTTGVSVSIPPNTVKNPDGSNFTGTLTLSESPVDAGDLPSNAKTCTSFTLEPRDVSFNKSVPVSLPNRDNLPANSKALFWAYDPARGSFVRSGVGKVLADGQSIQIIAGGLAGATSFFATPIPALAEETQDQPGSTYTPSLAGEGNLQTGHSVSGYYSLGRMRSSSLLYNSIAAAPQPIISAAVTVPANAPVPPQFDIELEIGGVKIPGSFTAQTSAPHNPSDPGIGESAVETLILQVAFDAAILKTGLYDYKLLIFSTFGCSAAAAEQTGQVFVNNRTDSPYGDGWKVTELQKLEIAPGGSAVIEEFDGSLKEFDQTPGVAAFDKQNFSIAVDRANHTAVGDLNGDGRTDIVIMEGTGKIVSFLNQGDGTFERKAEVAMGQPFAGTPPAGRYATDITDVILADLNEDGSLDIAVSRQLSADVAIAYGRGDGYFEPKIDIDTPSDSFSLATADYNKDGVTDLAILAGLRFGTISGRAQVVLNDGNGGFTVLPSTMPLIGAARVLAGDFDGDGKTDAVVDPGPTFLTQNAAGSYVHVAGSSGLSNIGGYQFQTVNIDAADLNADRKADFAIIDTNEVVVVVSKLKSWTFSHQRISFSAAGLRQPADVVFFDYDGDGDQDLLVQEELPNDRLVLWRNQGGGVFSAAPEFIPTGHNGREFRLEDMDGDGLKDLVTLQTDRLFIDYARADNGHYVAPAGDFTTLAKDANGNYLRTYKDGTVIAFNAQGQQVSVTDSNGNVTAYEYDAQGRLTRITDPVGLATVYAYGSSGRLASITTPDGRVTRYEYNARGEMIEIEQPDATTLSYAYDKGLMTSATDARGNITSYAYGAAGRYKGVEFPDGSEEKLQIARTLGLASLQGAGSTAKYVRPEDRFTFAADGNSNVTMTELNQWGSPLSISDALGRTTYFTRDANDLVILAKSPSGVISQNGPVPPPPDPYIQFAGIADPSIFVSPATRFAAMQLGPRSTASNWLSLFISQAHAQTAPNGATGFLETEYAYDNRGNLLKADEFVFRASISTQVIHFETQWEFQEYLNRVIKKVGQITYGLGPLFETTNYTYDQTGNLIEQKNTLNHTFTYTYNTRGQKLTQTDERGKITTFAYDAYGRLETVTDPSGTVFRQVYDGRGNVLLKIKAEGRPEEQRDSFTYDALNRLHTRMNGEGEVTTHGYDENGNLTVIEDATGVRWTRAFDKLNRIVETADPAEGKTTIAYDGAGNLSRVTGPDGAVSTLTYDAANRLSSFTDAAQGERRLAYDVRDNVIAITDAEGHTTTFAYNGFDQMVSRTDASGQTWSFEYDLQDRRKKLTLPSAKKLEMSYDTLGRLTGISPLETYRRSFTYDPANNLLTAVTLDETLTHLYDDLDRLTKVTASRYPHFLEYEYDALSRRKLMRDDLGAITRYEWDKADRLVAVIAPSGKRIEMARDQAGRTTALRYPNGLETRLSYDAQTGLGGTGRLTSIGFGLDALGQGGSAVHAGLGNLSYGYDNRGQIAQIAGTIRGTRNYAYDALKRLTGVTDGTAASLESYVLDREGNRVASHLSSLHLTDGVNRLTEDEQFIYAYDPNNNLQSRLPKLDFSLPFLSGLTYDGFDQLRSGGGVGTYLYDAFGRATRITGGSVGRRHLIWDGWDAVRIDERLDNLANPALQSRKWVTHGEGQDELLAATPKVTGTGLGPSNTSFYFHTDHQGSVLGLSDEAGLLVNQYSYDSHGRILTSVEGFPQPFRFTGQQLDPGGQVYYYKHRHYDPRTGRFLQEDPLWFEAGDLNTYRITWNDPVNWTDPLGLSAAGEYGGIAGATAAAAIRMRPVAAKVACVLKVLGDSLGLLAEVPDLVEIVTDSLGCRAMPKIAKVCKRLPKPVRQLVGLLSGFFSFDGDTPVLTRAGLKKLKDVQVGEEVAAWDEATNSVQYQKVTERYVRRANQALKVTVKDSTGKSETLIVTPEHPMLTPASAWTAISGFKVGDQIATASGKPITITAIEADTTHREVYNLEVAEDHSYAVGELGLWSHNGILYKLTRPDGKWKWGRTKYNDLRSRYPLDVVAQCEIVAQSPDNELLNSQ